MDAREISDSIKKATVAVMTRREDSTMRHPFRIIGSGFCVHPAGIVITANHVFQSFVKDQHHKSVLERVGEGVMVPTPMTIFGVLLYGGAEGSKVFMHEVTPAEVGIVNDFDIAVFKLREHPAFPNGFPTLEVADYADLYEMMPVATCGYPFGDFLWDQVGSVTSSFTTGKMSSILPAPGIARKHLSGFQLDLLSAPAIAADQSSIPRPARYSVFLKVARSIRREIPSLVSLRLSRSTQRSTKPD